MTWSVLRNSPDLWGGLALASGLCLLGGASGQGSPPELPAAPLTPPVRPDFRAHGERVEGFRELLGEQRTQALSVVLLERITTAVPWPRGLVARDGELVVLARGRHRNAGGLDAVHGRARAGRDDALPRQIHHAHLVLRHSPAGRHAPLHRALER